MSSVATSQRHWYVMIDCKFREPVDMDSPNAKGAPFWTKILPQQKMRGYFRCFALNAESKEAARKLACKDTMLDPYFQQNVSHIEVVEIEEIGRNEANYQRFRARLNGAPNTSHHTPDADGIWFRDGGGYYL